jgi:hypothetical protein
MYALVHLIVQGTIIEMTQGGIYVDGKGEVT